MAASKVSIIAGSRLEKSYRGWIRGSSYQEAEARVVLDGTVIMLRRHCTEGTVCSDCGNDDPDLCEVSNVDKLGCITEVQCVVCGKHLSTTCRRSKYYFERIEDPAVLQRGDHVGWYRPLAYWHHAIVTRQSEDRIAVVGYTISNRDKPCAKVTEEEYSHRSMASLLRGSVYRIVHDDCYTNEYAALRAERSIGEEKYDFFEQNCEHSTTWCKTGLHSSDQLESCFTSLGKVALAVLLRAAVLAVLWLLQICHLTQDTAAEAGGLSVERGVSVAYVSLIVTVFAIHSVYKGCSRVRSSVEPAERDPHDDDCMESCRKDCTDGFFRRCCGGQPRCSRLSCSICFVACFCCSFCQASCSLCAEKLRMCAKPCCGRPPTAVVSLLIRVVVRETIAASGPFIVVWFTDDILSYFDERNVALSDSEVVNHAVIVVAAITLASVVAYPVGVLVSRWVQGLIECCACGPSNREKCAKQRCPVHDEIVNVPGPHGDYHVTNIPVAQSANQCSAVILL